MFKLLNSFKKSHQVKICFWRFKKQKDIVFSSNSRSTSGALSLAFQNYPGVQRSRHPTNSCFAIGPNAKHILAKHDTNSSTYFPYHRVIELGGKNPNIIFSDSDFDKAVSFASRAAFTNQGQICLCGSRIFIQEDIYKKFKEALISKASKLKVGNPKDINSNLGAVVSEEHMNKILSKIEQSKQLGGKILFGGEREILNGEFKDGYYIQPTIIEGLPYDCDINQEEIFGPVVSMIPFKTEEEVIQMANSTKYGLSASIFTENISRAHRVAHSIDSGVIWINTWLLRDLRIPFGGMKHSGVGREGGFKSLEFFTEPKNICVKI